MQILTKNRIKKFGESYLFDKKNKKLTQKYKIGAISDLAFHEEKDELQKWIKIYCQIVESEVENNEDSE